MRKNSLLPFFVLVLAGILFAPCSLSRMMAQDRIPVCPPLNKVQKGVKPLREMIWANDTIPVQTSFSSASRLPPSRKETENNQTLEGDELGE